ncbi:MAG: hypothetical protein Fur005_24980 [Roseiflexaceae bacterium]
MNTLEPALLARIRRDYSPEGLEDLVQRLDLLHDFASAGRLHEATSLSRQELQGWLREVIYVARETMREIEEQEFVGRLPL